jgi:hypothetical protein
MDEETDDGGVELLLGMPRFSDLDPENISNIGLTFA